MYDSSRTIIVLQTGIGLIICEQSQQFLQHDATEQRLAFHKASKENVFSATGLFLPLINNCKQRCHTLGSIHLVQTQRKEQMLISLFSFKLHCLHWGTGPMSSNSSSNKSPRQISAERVKGRWLACSPSVSACRKDCL